MTLDEAINESIKKIERRDLRQDLMKSMSKLISKATNENTYYGIKSPIELAIDPIYWVVFKSIYHEIDKAIGIGTII